MSFFNYKSSFTFPLLKLEDSSTVTVCFFTVRLRTLGNMITKLILLCSCCDGVTCSCILGAGRTITLVS